MLQAHVLLHFIRSSNEKQSSGKNVVSDRSVLDRSLSTHLMPTAVDFEAQIAESCKIVSSSYELFKREAAEQVSMMQCSFSYKNSTMSHKRMGVGRYTSIDDLFFRYIK